MNKLLGMALMICQHLCTALAVIVTAYLLYRWNIAREADPGGPDPFNPWWPGLVLAALGAVFGLARKGLAQADDSKR